MDSMKLTRIPIVLLATLFFAVACRQAPNPPQPSLTGTPGSEGGSQYPGWVSPEDISSAGIPSDLPPVRDTSLNPNDEGRIEGLLPSVYFDFDQSAIRPGDRGALQEAADYLLQNPGARLILEGHCDWRGTAEYNMALGERRAASAMEYILSLGIDPSRMEIVSMGDLEAMEVDSEAQLQEDRRADLIVIP
jgi:peptidoglycan-associated lipoprotein